MTNTSASRFGRFQATLTCVAAALLLLGSIADARAAEPGQTVAREVAAHALEDDFNGVVLVRRGDEPLFRGAFGLADRAFGVEIEPDTRFRIASITKLFTATLALQLVDDGRLDLAAPVETYLPDYAGDGAISVRTLLNHTSGLPNPDADITFEGAVTQGIPLYQLPHTSDALLADYASGPPIAPPGTAFDYNNADYIVLGKIIEAITGQTFEAALSARILDPLGLADTGMARQRDVIPQLAPTYLRPGEDEPVINDLPVLIENWYAAGAMYSTADDLARFADALYGGRLIRPETLTMMLTPGLEEHGYGLWVWEQQDAEGRPFRAAVRFGGIMGANGVLYRILDEDVTIIILSNTNTTDIGAFADRIAKAVLAEHR